jgi:single-stranded-DNA-specific exonuclease
MDAHDPAHLARIRGALLDAEHIAPHSDADGLAAAAIVLRARGETADHACLLTRTQTPWGEDPDLPDGSVALLDQGLRPFARAGVIVDHHTPDTDDPGVPALTSFGARPETPTAPLTRRVLPEMPAWLAGVGAVGDLGPAGLDLPECDGAPKASVQRLVPLVNAPRRLATGPVRTALSLLVEHDSPQDVLDDPRIRVLERARREAREVFDRVIRIAPRIHGDVAVIRFCVPYLVHPLVAAAWTRRLAPRPVLVANDGWVPGRVNFSVRGGHRDLQAMLHDALPDPEDGDVGNGHARATGGSLSPSDFERLLRGLAAADRAAA